MSKDVFYTKTFMRPNHIPPTGLGYFDASYNPDSCQLKVAIRFGMSFVDTSYQWTDESKIQFKQEFLNRIPEYWNNKFIIRCTKNGWRDVVAIPEFTLQEGANRHFDIRAAGTTGTSNTAVRRFGIGHNYNREPEAGLNTQPPFSGGKPRIVGQTRLFN